MLEATSHLLISKSHEYLYLDPTTHPTCPIHVLQVDIYKYMYTRAVCGIRHSELCTTLFSIDPKYEVSSWELGIQLVGTNDD